MVDAYASGAYVAIHGGSSPLPGTTQKRPFAGSFLCGAREARHLLVSREDLKMLSMSQRAAHGEVRRETCTAHVMRKIPLPGTKIKVQPSAEG